MRRYFNLTIAVIAVIGALVIAPTQRPRASNTATPTSPHVRPKTECPPPDYWGWGEWKGEYIYYCHCFHGEGATHGPG